MRQNQEQSRNAAQAGHERRGGNGAQANPSVAPCDPADIPQAELDPFSRFTNSVSRLAGRSIAFIAAVVAILLWAALGPVTNYSESWQLMINTTTTIITFLMVFIIQNSQNREIAAIQLKLAELIRVHRAAHDSLLDLEMLPPDELDRLRERFEKIAHAARSGEIDAEALTDAAEALHEAEETRDEARSGRE